MYLIITLFSLGFISIDKSYAFIINLHYEKLKFKLEVSNFNCIIKQLIEHSDSEQVNFPVKMIKRKQNV